MKHKLILFISVLLGTVLFSCNNDQSAEKPENLIPEPQMIEVLTDICKVEARFQRRLSVRGKDNSELVLQNYNVIFNAHNVTLPQFKTSFEYYENSPKKMQELYDSVIVILTKEEALLKKEEEQQKQK